MAASRDVDVVLNDPMRALKLAAGVGVTLVALVAVVWVVGLFGYGAGATADGAVKACHKDVETRLKSPRSAEYADETTEKVGDGKWVVKGSVDADNAFGASLRSRYECTAHSGDGDHWTTTDVYVAP